jgi:hypothetical protein
VFSGPCFSSFTGYADSKDYLYLHQLRDKGRVVELGGVGGAMPLVKADAHREGLTFPPYVYNKRIETGEGLADRTRHPLQGATEVNRRVTRKPEARSTRERP